MRAANGQTATAEFEVVRNQSDGGSLNVVGFVDGNRLAPVVYQGVLETGPVGLYGWPIILSEVSGQTKSFSSGLFGVGSREPFLLRIAGGELIGKCGAALINLRSAVESAPPMQQLLDEVLAPGRRFRATLRRGEQMATIAVLRVNEVTDGGGRLYWTAVDEADEGVLQRLEGASLQPSSPDYFSWPIKLQKQRSSSGPYSQESMLIGLYEKSVRLRPTPGGGLVGWCDDERIEAVPIESAAPEIPLSGEPARERLLAAVAPELEWTGKAKSKTASSLPISLRFTSSGERGERLIAEVRTSSKAGVTAKYAGSLSLDAEKLNGWAFSLERKEKISPYASGEVLGHYPKRLILRLTLDGRLVGWCGEAEWIELSPPELVADSAGAVEALDNEQLFWDKLADVDQLLDAGQPDAAWTALKAAKKLASDDRGIKTILDVREGLVYLGRAELQTSSKERVRLLKRAEDKLAFVETRKVDGIDPNSVSARAMGAYYLAYIRLELRFNFDNQKKTHNYWRVMKVLKLDLGSALDREGVAWYERALSDHRKGRSKLEWD